MRTDYSIDSGGATSSASSGASGGIVPPTLIVNFVIKT